MKRFIKPLPTHNRIHFDKRQVIALVGPWGSGKSTVCAVELAVHCSKYKCDGLVVRDTYPALIDSCCAKWEELFEGLGEMNWGPPPTWYWTNELRDRKVLFRSAQDAEDIQKFGSVEVGAAWLEEVTPGLLPGGQLNIGMAPEVLGGVFGRMRKWHTHDNTPDCSTVPGEACDHRKLLISALPPPSTKHWFHSLFYDKRALNRGLSDEQSNLFVSRSGLYRLTPEENSKNLPPDYYTLQAAFLTSEDQVQRFLRGEVGSGYGKAAIYGDQWNDALHINDKIVPSTGPMVIGVDGGMDASAVFLQIQPSGRCYILGELPTQGLGLEDFAYAALQYGGLNFGQRSYQVWCDPSIFSRGPDGRSAATHLQAGGLIARPGPQDPKIRIGAVRTWLSRFGSLGPIVQVHPRCEMIIEGFRGSYHWKIAGGVPLIGKPDKNEFSHPHDALQYPLAGLLRKAETGEGQKLPAINPDILGRVNKPAINLSRFTRRPPS
jgi:hypothetical protein